MEKTTLANGVDMPLLGLGVYRSSPEDTITAVSAALSTGYRLIDTAGLYLEETNDWGDQFWGVDGTGLNMLGHTLMFVRDFVLPNHPHI